MSNLPLSTTKQDISVPCLPAPIVRASKVWFDARVRVRLAPRFPFACFLSVRFPERGTLVASCRLCPHNRHPFYIVSHVLRAGIYSCRSIDELQELGSHVAFWTDDVVREAERGRSRPLCQAIENAYDSYVWISRLDSQFGPFNFHTADADRPKSAPRSPAHRPPCPLQVSPPAKRRRSMS